MAEYLKNDETKEVNKWISFEEEREIPFLPQPPSRVNNLSSESYIERLEQKLHRIKDPSKITSKNILSTLTEARESQMNNLVNKSFDPVSPSHETSNNMNWDEEITESKCCCVSWYSYLFPKQAKATQEVECLLDEDELAIISSEQTDDHYEDCRSASG